MNFEEALEILGIQPETELTPAVITTAFRASILTWHPDKNPSVDTTEKSRQILEARDELMKYLDTRRFADNATDEAAKPQPEGSDRAAEAKVSKRFPPVIHVVQCSPEDEGFENTCGLYIKTLYGQSIRVMISCGRSTPLFKPRSMHEALILTYLSCHPEQTIEALIESKGLLTSKIRCYHYC
jgi:hypothetical protein